MNHLPETTPPTLRDCAAQALELRGWALGVLTGRSAAAPPPAERTAWEIFLKVERCAHPLRTLLAAAEVEVDALGHGELARCGVNEAMHVLAFRDEAARLARLLAERGWEGVVLKGGTSILGGGTEVDVRDMDLLVSREHALPFAAALDAAGYQRGEVELRPGAPGRHELAGRKRPNGMLVEVHYALPPVSADVNVAATGPLPLAPFRRLAPTEHLWHVLTHGALHHPERRGSLRDLVVAATAVGWCTPDEVAAAVRRAEARGDAPALARMLEMARAMNGDGELADLFTREAATAYLLYAYWVRRRPREHALLALGRTAHALTAANGEYGRLWVGTPVSAFSRGYAGHRWIDRHVPLAGAAGRALWRAAHLAAAAVPGAWMARTARHLVAAAATNGA